MSLTGIRTKAMKDWAKTPQAIEIGHELKKARVKANMSPNDVGEALGFTDETYNRLENSRTGVPLYRLFDIAEFFGYEVRLVKKEASHDAEIKA